MVRYIYIIFITLMLCLIACTPSRPADDLSVAEAALEQYNYGVAYDLCQQVSSGDVDKLSVRDLCRLSLLYMKLSDLKDLEDNALVATDFYRKANAINEDSAKIFYDNLPIEDARYVELMSQLQRILDHPREMTEPITIPEYE